MPRVPTSCTHANTRTSTHHRRHHHSPTATTATTATAATTTAATTTTTHIFLVVAVLLVAWLPIRLLLGLELRWLIDRVTEPIHSANTSTGTASLHDHHSEEQGRSVYVTGPLVTGRRAGYVTVRYCTHLHC